MCTRLPCHPETAVCQDLNPSKAPAPRNCHTAPFANSDGLWHCRLLRKPIKGFPRPAARHALPVLVAWLASTAGLAMCRNAQNLHLVPVLRMRQTPPTPVDRCHRREKSLVSFAVCLAFDNPTFLFARFATWRVMLHLDSAVCLACNDNAFAFRALMLMVPHTLAHHSFVYIKLFSAHPAMVYSSCFHLAYHLTVAKRTSVTKCFLFYVPIFHVKPVSANRSMVHLPRLYLACDLASTKGAIVTKCCVSYLTLFHSKALSTTTTVIDAACPHAALYLFFAKWAQIIVRFLAWLACFCLFLVVHHLSLCLYSRTGLPPFFFCFASQLLSIRQL